MMVLIQLPGKSLLTTQRYMAWDTCLLKVSWYEGKTQNSQFQARSHIRMQNISQIDV